MSEAAATTVRWRDLSIAIGALVISIGFLLWAMTYPPRSGAVPELVAWATIVFALIDVAIQFETPWSRALRRLVTAEKIVAWTAEGDEDASLGRVVAAILWVAAYVVLLYFFGFLIATPVYLLAYMLLHGKLSVLTSLLVTAGTALTVYLTFEVFFRYPLYPGVLFGGY